MCMTKLKSFFAGWRAAPAAEHLSLTGQAAILVAAVYNAVETTNHALSWVILGVTLIHLGVVRDRRAR